MHHKTSILILEFNDGTQDLIVNGVQVLAGEIAKAQIENITKAPWCRIHNREATSHDINGRPRCDTRLGGIMIPCETTTVPLASAESVLRCLDKAAATLRRVSKTVYVPTCNISTPL